MGEGTKYSKLKELLQKFCDDEYRGSHQSGNHAAMSANDFTFFSVDCGGYDVCWPPAFIVEDDKFWMVFGDDVKFEFKLVEEE